MAAAKNKKKTKPAQKKNDKPEVNSKEQVVRFQITVICLIVLAVFSFLAVYSDTLGIAGSFIRGCLGIVIGGGAYLFPLWFVGVAVYALRKKGVKVKLNCYISGILLVMVSALAESWTNSESLSKLVEHGRFLKGGGVLGGGIFFLLRSVCTRVGAVIILLALIIVFVIILTRFSLRDFLKKAKEAEKLVREEEAEEQKQQKQKKQEKPVNFDDFVPKAEKKKRMEVRPLKPIFDIPLEDDDFGTPVSDEPEDSIVPEDIPQPPEEMEYIHLDVAPAEVPSAIESENEVKEEKNEKKSKADSKSEEFVPDEAQPVRYVKPPITLLEQHKGNNGVSAKDIKMNSQKLVDVLQSFGVTAKVIGASTGPTVTRYEIVAASGTKFSKIAGLSEIPAIVLERDDRKVAEIALIENIQREDLNPIEEAMAYKALAEEYGIQQAPTLVIVHDGKAEKIANVSNIRKFTETAVAAKK